jgi:hypothetical protein
MDDFYDLELETGEIISPLIYSKEMFGVFTALVLTFDDMWSARA